MLRHVGDLNDAEIAARVFAGVDAVPLLAELERERRAIRLRVGGEQRYVAADEAGLYRDALSAAPPGGLPEAFLADVPDALRVLVARYARTHGPFTTDELRERYGVDAGAVLRELERDGELVRGELRPGGSGREWCDVEVLRRLRRASLAALRKEIEPADQRALAAFLPSWQGVDRHSPAGAGIDRLREVLVPLQGLALPAEIWERDVLPRRTGAYSTSWLDMLCASGELVWVGAGPLGRSGRVALYFREDAPLIGPPASNERRAGAAPRRRRTDTPEHDQLRERLRTPCFFSDLIAELDVPAEALREALWDLVWAGEATNDAWAPLRAPHLSLRARDEPLAASDIRPALWLTSHRRAVTGAGSLGADRADLPSGRAGRRRLLAHGRRVGPGAPPSAGRAAAGALRHRHARAGACGGHQGRLRDALRHAVQPRDAGRLPPRLLRRGHGRRAVRAARRGRAPALSARRAQLRRRPLDGRLVRAHARTRARRRGPRTALWRGAFLAQTRGPGAPPVARGGCLRGVGRRSSRRCMWSAAGVAC